MVRFIDRFQALAERRDHIFVAELAPAATENALREAEDFVGAALPASLRRLLTVHNGMSFRFINKKRYSQVPCPYPSCELSILSTEDVVKRTSNFREYMDGIDLIDSSRQYVYKCFEFALTGENINWRIVFSLDERRADGEYGILEADVDTLEFVSRREGNEQAEVLADSFDTFFERALRFMQDTEGGFTYWWPPNIGFW